ncbi:MAG: NAD(P)H-dependent oxidoreductase subunit E [Clostridia bacterium]|nr:NAD(P)H-dependent oxidoreductase subunit E [Clostridia bacterium]
MKKKISSVKFKGTKEQEAKLLGVINKYKELPGAVMPILQEAQNIYGYLPIEVQTIIADRLDLPLREIFSIATFYSQFSLSPRGKYEVSVCLGTACYVKGSDKILEKVRSILHIDTEECTTDGKFSLTSCRCIGACGLAPVMTINDDVYSRLKPDAVEDILKKYM